MEEIERIEKKKSGEKKKVGLGKDGKGKIEMMRKILLKRVEGREKLMERLIIGLMSGGEERKIKKIVDIGIDEVIESIDMVEKGRRVEIESGIEELIERVVKNEDDLGGLVGKDGLEMIVKEKRKS